MGLFGPYIYKTKKGQKFFLHSKERGKSRLYYFSKEQEGAMSGLPGGFEVVENPKSSLPFLKRKTSGFLGLFGKPKEEKTEVKEEKKTEE
jgi:hypothetical protein